MRKELAKRTAESWKRVVISQCFSSRAKELEGKSIAELAERANQDPVEFALDLLESEPMSPNAIFYSMSEENMERIYKKDWVMVGTDAGARGFSGVLAKGKPHPREFGSFPRFISQMVNKKKILSLAQAVRKSSALAAEHFRIKDRGKISKGYYADLVMFDPEGICDCATFENPFQAPHGIEMVMVNGEIVAMNGEITGRLPGRPLEMKL